MLEFTVLKEELNFELLLANDPVSSLSFFDRPALSMIQEAERKGLIKPGATLIEATSGNTGIALAMAAAIKGYEMILIMPSNMSEERRTSMAAYGAKLLSVRQNRVLMSCSHIRVSITC